MRPEQPSDPQRRSLVLASGTVSYTDVGEGPGLVAVHGLPGSVRDFRWLGAGLEPHLRVVRLDLPGFGETLASVAPATADGIADLVGATLEALALERVVLLGHSFGTAFAVRAAQRHPSRIAGLALLGPVGRRPHRGFRRWPAKAAFVRGLRTPGLRLGLRPLLRRLFAAAGFPQVTDDEVMWVLGHLANFDFAAHRDALQSLTVPTFVAHCRDDPLIEPAIVEELVASLPSGPRLWFDSGRHNLQKTRSLELADALVPWAVRCVG